MTGSGKCGYLADLKEKLDFALGGRRDEAAFFIVTEDGIDHVFRFVDHAHQVDILVGNHALAHQRGLQPVGKAFPEWRADEDDRYGRDFPRLHQGKRLEQFVQGAETAGHDDIGGSELDEHDLAREEMLEGLADVLVEIGALLVRQLDIEPDARRFAWEADGPLFGPVDARHSGRMDAREPG